jgi:hypothetical protein
MVFDPPLNVSFKSLIKDGKFWTLDEAKEVSSSWYMKWINSIDDLTPIEINYILIRYSNLNKVLGEMTTLIATARN